MTPPSRPLLGSASGAAPVGAELLSASLDEFARRELAQLDAADLTRSLRRVEQYSSRRLRLDGRELLGFASCDYLGLARHPALVEAAARALREAGTSTGSARLLAGNDPAVEALEEELASFFGAPAALSFGSGYHANVGLVTALAGKGDLILSDALSHASTVDGCRLSGAELRVLPHDDLDALASALDDAPRYERTLVCVEGLYSMDGDGARLDRVLPLAAQAGASVLVDDAHGLGVLGPGGRGALAASFDARPGASTADAATPDAAPDAASRSALDHVVQVGNLGKALGSYGAFALMPSALRELLLQTARTFVFTCALPPAVVAAARTALSVLREEPQRVERAQANARRLRALFVERELPLVASRRPEAPILPVLLGTTARAQQVAAALLERGLFVPAIRPPTVPEGTCRLRVSVSAEHEETDLLRLADALVEILA